MDTLFRKFATKISLFVGSPVTFFIAVLMIATWALTGPIFGFSDTWQLVINTSTTIVTFLIVFLIQNTQNRDARAMQLKLDELIHGVKGARSSLINIEEMSDADLEELQEEFRNIQEKYNAAMERRKNRKNSTSSK
jgi:low affinity Fe/Cu permease